MAEAQAQAALSPGASTTADGIKVIDAEPVEPEPDPLPRRHCARRRSPGTPPWPNMHGRGRCPHRHRGR